MSAYPILLTVPPGTLTLDQQIPNTRYGTGGATPADLPYHVQLVDLYEPNGIISFVAVALHGGGGNKYQYSATLGLLRGWPPTADKVFWGSLEYWHLAMMIPQGNHCEGVNPLWGAGNNPYNPHDVNTVSADYPYGIPTWSNHLMYSGVDDVQFIKDCATFASTRWGAATPRILAGHSNGGFMANTSWYEHIVNSYQCYCSTSGSAPPYYIANPATPAIVKPYFATYGHLDINLEITGTNFYEPVWYLSQVSKAFVDTPPTAIGALQQLQVRVNAYNTYHSLPAETVSISAGVTVAVAIGTRTTWTYSGGDNIICLYSDADHSNVSLAKCQRSTNYALWILFLLKSLGF